MKIFEELLAKLGTALDGAKLPYMVISGQAVLIHGEPRLTRDIDITLGVDAEAYVIVETMVRDLGLHIIPGEPEAFVRQHLVLPVIEPSTQIRINLVFSLLEYERQAISRAVRIEIGSVLAAFASIEDTIIHKLFAGRPRDIEDVRGILKTGKPIDNANVDRWLAGLSGSATRDLAAEYYMLLERIRQ